MNELYILIAFALGAGITYLAMRPHQVLLRELMLGEVEADRKAHPVKRVKQWLKPQKEVKTESTPEKAFTAMVPPDLFKLRADVERQEAEAMRRSRDTARMVNDSV